MRLGLIDRYIIKEFVLYFGACLVSLVGIALTFVVLSELDTLGEPEGTRLFIEAILAAIPLLVELTLPIAVLLGTILTFSSLSKTSEITAMHAAGISLPQLMKPVLLVGAFILGFAYFNQSYLAPWWGAEKKLDFAAPTEPKTYWRFYQGRLYYFTDLDKTQQRAGRAGGIGFGADRKVNEIIRFEGIKQLEEGWQIGAGLDLLIDGERLTYQSIMARQAETEALPVVFKPELPHPKYTSFWALINEIRIKAQGAVNYQSDLFAMYQKISALVAVFTMMLLALPFSLFSGRQANVRTGIVVAVVLGFVFWLADQLFVSFFEAGALPAPLAAFGSNVVFIILGLVLIRRKLN
ncbi:MAG: LptF/LptG family permease [bacterium]|nr:LptF/LptG family permease [bacterium]